MWGKSRANDSNVYLSLGVDYQDGPCESYSLNVSVFHILILLFNTDFPLRPFPQTFPWKALRAVTSFYTKMQGGAGQHWTWKAKRENRKLSGGKGGRSVLNSHNWAVTTSHCGAKSSIVESPQRPWIWVEGLHLHRLLQIKERKVGQKIYLTKPQNIAYGFVETSNSWNMLFLLLLLLSYRKVPCVLALTLVMVLTRAMVLACVSVSAVSPCLYYLPVLGS